MRQPGTWRAYVISFCIFALFCVVASRLFFLQIKNYKLYQAQAIGQQVIVDETVGKRGQIFSQNSQASKGKSFSEEVKSVAVNHDQWAVSVSPALVADRPLFAKTISPLIGLESAAVEALLESGAPSVVLRRGLSTEELDGIKNAGLEGVWWQNSATRLYPQESMASQVVGFLGGEGSGQYGVEGYYEDILRGKSGLSRQSKGLSALFETTDTGPLDGSDIYLTIDYNIQFQAEAILKEADERFGIASGQIIVMRPDSGKILAMANYPAFDLNAYGKQRDLDIFQNSATQKLFEPGSIMKPLTMAMAINEGKISPDTVYEDTGKVTLSGKTVRNFNEKVYGRQTMTQVLEESINTGAVYASQQISKQTFLDYIRRFGFTEKTGVDLQGESYSRNEGLKINAPDINFATASFGQGIEVTPLQMARAFCAIANGGRLPRPYAVEKINSAGEEIITQPELSYPVFSEKTAGQVRDMLLSVVENGYNGTAKIPGYYIGGKTGTAQIPLKNGKGYEGDDKTIQSFIGFGPVYNPQFVILVKLDQPNVSRSSLSAVPLFKKLAKYVIDYWQIPPDYEIPPGD